MNTSHQLLHTSSFHTFASFFPPLQKNWLCASQDDSLLPLTALAELTLRGTTTLQMGLDSNISTHSSSPSSQLLSSRFLSVLHSSFAAGTLMKGLVDLKLPVDNPLWHYDHSINDTNAHQNQRPRLRLRTLLWTLKDQSQTFSAEILHLYWWHCLEEI